MARAIKRKAKTTKGWGKRAPKTQQQRRRLLERCGPRAFLDPANLKYPIMAKSGRCVVDCQGLRAAKSRAGQMKSEARRARRSPAKFIKLEKKAQRKGAGARCRWA